MDLEWSEQTRLFCDKGICRIEGIKTKNTLQSVAIVCYTCRLQKRKMVLNLFFIDIVVKNK